MPAATLILRLRLRPQEAQPPQLVGRIDEGSPCRVPESLGQPDRIVLGRLLVLERPIGLAFAVDPPALIAEDDDEPAGSHRCVLLICCVRPAYPTDGRRLSC